VNLVLFFVVNSLPLMTSLTPGPQRKKSGMKLRIKGNSLRIRLTKTEVSKLAETGYLEEKTNFPNNRLIYVLQKTDSEELSAKFENNIITLFVPHSFTKEWPQNDEIGVETKMPLSQNEFLYLLLEKDFACLDKSTEDQSDNFDNPNQTC
jgi:hypothetical protein